MTNIDTNCKVFSNCLPAVALDLMIEKWPTTVTEKQYQLILCANTLHITPNECTKNLLVAASNVLTEDGVLIVYGPFKMGGNFIGTDGGLGNEKFDKRLRETNASWGLRDVKEIEKIAESCNLSLKGTINMPANNLLIRFGRKGHAVT